MPVHVENMTSELSVFNADLPLSDAQIDAVVKIVLERLERKQRDNRHGHDATVIRDSVIPRSEPADW